MQGWWDEQMGDWGLRGSGGEGGRSERFEIVCVVWCRLSWFEGAQGSWSATRAWIDFLMEAIFVS